MIFIPSKINMTINIPSHKLKKGFYFLQKTLVYKAN